MFGGGSCDINYQPAQISAGVFVLVHHTVFDGNTVSVFSLTNDLVVGCDCSSTAGSTIPETPRGASDTIIAGSDNNKEPMLGGSIVMEMLR